MPISLRSLLPALLLLTLPPSAHARLVPVYPVNYLCLKARYIVEGKYLGNSKLTIEKIYKGADYLSKETQLTATGLEKCSRILGELNTGKSIDAIPALRTLLQSSDHQAAEEATLALTELGATP